MHDLYVLVLGTDVQYVCPSTWNWCTTCMS